MLSKALNDYNKYLPTSAYPLTDFNFILAIIQPEYNLVLSAYNYIILFHEKGPLVRRI